MATETVEEPFDDDEFVPGPDYDSMPSMMKTATR